MKASGREKQTTAEKLSPAAIPLEEALAEPDFNGLPPVVRSKNSVVQEKIEKYLKMKSDDSFDLIENIRTHKDFGNPKVLLDLLYFPGKVRFLLSCLFYM